MEGNQRHVKRAALALTLAACAIAGQRWWVGDHIETRQWTLAGVQGREIRVAVMHGACEDFDHIKVTESANRVTVAGFALVPNHIDACSDVLSFHCETFLLAEPLGDRRLWHAPAESVYWDVLDDAPRRASTVYCTH